MPKPPSNEALQQYITALAQKIVALQNAGELLYIAHLHKADTAAALKAWEAAVQPTPLPNDPRTELQGSSPA